jgi:tRNA/rRNA methyltransferase
VIGADEAAHRLAPHVAAGENAAIVFGRERNGLENDEVGLADAIVTLPVNPAFASLNLAQAVVILSYEWFKHATAGALPFAMPEKSPPAPREQLLAFFGELERELERIEYFRPEEKRGTMVINMRNIFHRMQPTQQDIRTLHGVITALVQGRKGPARGGVLDGPQAEILRTLLAERGEGPAPTDGSPVRGLARLLRRNPTEAERLLWTQMTNDRRFVGLGFKRQTPVGPHITDFVSFPLRTAIDLVPAQESAEAAATRTARCAYLKERGYRVVEVKARDVERDVGEVLGEIYDKISAAIVSKP